MTLPRQEEFLRLLGSNHRSIYGFLVSLVGERNTADDLMQEVSLILWRKFDAFNLDASDVNGSFLKWSLVTAKNLVRNHHRLSRSQAMLLDNELISKIAMTRCASDELLDIRRQALQQCLARLSEVDRQHLALCYGSGTSLKSVAVLLGKSLEALYMSLSRIRRRLFHCINRRLGL